MQQPAPAEPSYKNGYKIRMKRLLYILVCLFVWASAFGQTVNYEQRYDLLVSKFGPTGVGVETVLDNWAKTDSTNMKLLTARFSYYFAKSKSDKIVKLPQKKYLGMDPLLSLKDSTGTNVYYFQEPVFDDEIYGEALKSADRAINIYPDCLDFRFMKANAYISYEKESPDMALAYLIALAADDAAGRYAWKYEGKPVKTDFFVDSMLEYCYSFYSTGSKKSMDAFLKLSEKMNSLHPEHPGFLNNIGSYYMISEQDYKTALKYYGKVLKKHPQDYTAIKNSLIAARKLKNEKLEKKYLQMVAKYGPETERRQAEMILKSRSK